MAGNYDIVYVSQGPLYTKEELLLLNETLRNANTKQFEPGYAKAANKKVKVYIVQWLEVKKHLKKFEDFIYSANDKFFQYDIFDISDFNSINVNEYNTKYNSYDWHIDCSSYGSKEDIKLTCLLNISTESYSGGKLHLDGMSDIDEKGQEIIFKDFNIPGYVLLFTSYRRHKVEPVTNGERRTLSYWATGPAWR